MYGCPYVDYKVSGTVVDPEGNPVEGIQVETAPDFLYCARDTTAIDGGFEIVSGDISLPDSLYFRDIDGDLNGSFRTKGVKISNKFEQVKEASGMWYDGGYEAKGIEVVLSDSDKDTINPEP